MDITSIGIAGVASITAICLLVGLIMKSTPWKNDKYIPIACGVSGGILGLLALYVGLPDFPATDPITAVAIGIVSGLAATGMNQIVKQINKGE